MVQPANHGRGHRDEDDGSQKHTAQILPVRPCAIKQHCPVVFYESSHGVQIENRPVLGQDKLFDVVEDTRGKEKKLQTRTDDKLEIGEKGNNGCGQKSTAKDQQELDDEEKRKC